jgi:hypothetical protein
MYLDVKILLGDAVVGALAKPVSPGLLDSEEKSSTATLQLIEIASHSAWRSNSPQAPSGYQLDSLVTMEDTYVCSGIRSFSYGTTIAKPTTRCPLPACCCAWRMLITPRSLTMDKLTMKKLAMNQATQAAEPRQSNISRDPNVLTLGVDLFEITEITGQVGGGVARTLLDARKSRFRAPAEP